MTTTLQFLFWGAMKLLLVAFGLLYVGAVLMSSRTDGPHYRPKFDRHDPARSAERFLVWLGVQAVKGVVWLGRKMLDTLFEASAELGEWYIRRRGREADAFYRSRFI